LPCRRAVLDPVSNPNPKPYTFTPLLDNLINELLSILEKRMEAQICVQDLTKVYRVPEREAGLKAAFTSLIKRKYNDVLAVDHISFEVQTGRDGRLHRTQRGW
jgi:hypothetical protein